MTGLKFEWAASVASNVRSRLGGRVAVVCGCLVLVLLLDRWST